MKISYVGVERDDADSVVVEADSEETRSLLAWRHATKRHADDVSVHLLAFGVLVELTSLKHETDHTVKLNTTCKWLRTGSISK